MANNCWITLYENDDFDGDHKTFNGPATYDDLSGKENDHMSNSVNSFKTGSQTWVMLYDDKGCDTGYSIFFGPNSSINLDDYKKPSGHTWQNAVESMIVYDTPIVNFDIVKADFWEMYPNKSDLKTDGSRHYYEYYTQNTHYRLYDPVLTFDESTKLYSVVMDTQFSRDGANDDATITFNIDQNGAVNGGISISYHMHSGQVPDWAITLIDAAINITDTTLKIIEDGVEVVVTEAAASVLMPFTNIAMDSVADVLIFAVDHVNYVLRVVGRLTEDGGTAYFADMNTQVVQRMLSSFQKEIYQIPPPSLTKMNLTTLQNQFGSTFVSDGDGNNEALTYENNSHHYRMWKPELSSMYTGNGIVCSCKIDHQNDNKKDDHMGLIAVFDNKGRPVAIYGNVMLLEADETEFSGDNSTMTSNLITYGKDSSGNPKLIKVTQDADGNRTATDITSTTDIITAYVNSLQTEIDNADSHDDFKNATKNFPQASKVVLQAWKNSLYTDTNNG